MLTIKKILIKVTSLRKYYKVNYSSAHSTILSTINDHLFLQKMPTF